jgi:hypothetical protein
VSYVKWVRNADRQDGVSRLLLEDDKEVLMGVPIELSADVKKQLESEGRVFEDSSATEAKEAAAQLAQAAQVGADVAGAAPVFQNAGPANQTTTTTDTGQTSGDDTKNDSK